jgi:hypothetical protein
MARMWRMWTPTFLGPDVGETGCGHPLFCVRMWVRMWTGCGTGCGHPLLHPFFQERSGGPVTPTFHPPTFHPLFTFTHDPRQAADEVRMWRCGCGHPLFEPLWDPHLSIRRRADDPGKTNEMGVIRGGIRGHSLWGDAENPGIWREFRERRFREALFVVTRNPRQVETAKQKWLKERDIANGL